VSEAGTVTELLLGIAMLSAIVGALTLLILLVRARLLPSGRVRLTINGAKDIKIPAGGKLHEALRSAGLLLPSACGGKGTCGQCRVQVLKGGGELLPTEAALINRREAAGGFRLACQVTVAEDLAVRLPEHLLETRQWSCRVRSNDNVATFIKELLLELPPGEILDFMAGAYVQIESPPYSLRYDEFDIGPEYRDDWRRLGLLKLESGSEIATTRAYSMANSPLENEIVKLNVRIATPPPNARRSVPPGVVSSWIFNLKPADSVTVSGPFGDFFYRDSDAEMIYVGGGAGMAPMRSHILDLLERLHSRRRISFWYGARSLREAFYTAEFERLAREHSNFSFHLALSEPQPEVEWTGPTGFVHDVLREQYLATHPAPEDCEYYLCGPPAMIAAVNQLLYEMGVEDENIMFDDFGG